MALEGRLTQDLKAAMLAGQQQHVMTLRGVKSALLYAKVADKRDRTQELSDEAVVAILAKESKKRQESADLYVRGGNQTKADAELAEKAIIDAYLPAQLSEAEVNRVIDEVLAKLGADSPVGQVIGAVKQQAGVAADGALIARLVKERLN